MDSPLTWSAELSVGNEALDRQHQQLLEISQRAERCAQEAESQSASNFHLLLNDIAVLFDRHFNDEENILEQNASPNLEFHKAEHDRYRARLTDLLCDASVGRIDRQELYRLTCDYLNEHLQKTDRADQAAMQAQPAESHTTRNGEARAS